MILNTSSTHFPAFGMSRKKSGTKKPLIPPASELKELEELYKSNQYPYAKEFLLRKLIGMFISFKEDHSNMTPKRFIQMTDGTFRKIDEAEK